MFTWLSRLRRGRRGDASRPQRLSSRLTCESLEERTTPSVSAISSNFNGTAIPAGDYVWFTSVAKVSGNGSNPVTLDISDATIDFTSDGAAYSLSVPNSAVVLSPSTTTASTSFGSGGWSISAPTNFSGNVFLSGLGWQAANGLAGGSVNNITWTADFTTTTPGVSVNWQWGAAVYTTFTSNQAGIEVKTVDDNHVDTYQNSDHAGTPENFKPFVIGGARGGGGSNWTGSYSATASVQPNQQTNTASIAGTVMSSSGEPVEWATVTLTGNGQTMTTTTDQYGNYCFGSLAAGTYTVTVTSVYGILMEPVSLMNGQTDTGVDFTYTTTQRVSDWFAADVRACCFGLFRMPSLNSGYGSYRSSTLGHLHQAN